MVTIGSRRAETAVKARDVPFTLDRLSPLPLHYQLQQHLRDAISAGVYGLGASIPPEPDLAAQLRVSRFTVRQAIDNLVRDGMLNRQRGRGTFVTAVTGQSSQRGADHDGAVSELSGLSPAMQEPRVEETAGAARIQRLRLVDDAPAVIETITLPGIEVERVGDGMIDEDAIGDLIGDKWGSGVSRVEETVRVIRLDGAAAHTLGVRTGSPGLRIERQSYVGHNLAETRELQLAGDRVYVTGASVSGQLVKQ